MLFLHEISNPFALLLWAASVCCFIQYYFSDEKDDSTLYLGFVLIIVIFATATITFHFNKKSLALMDSFSSFMP